MVTDKVFDFYQSLHESHQCQDLPFWKEVYQGFFGDGITLVNNSQKGPHQILGIDRTVVLPDSRVYHIEEKVDYHDNKNMFIEYWSDVERQVPGWINKTLFCDYLVYAILALGESYFFKPLPLQKTWRNNQERWIEEYGEKKVNNRSGGRTYTTIGVPVPVDEVYRQYKLSHRVRFTPLSKQNTDHCQPHLFR